MCGRPKLATGQYLAFARDRLRQDDIECRQAVGGHDQQMIRVDLVDIADAPIDQRQADSAKVNRASLLARLPRGNRASIASRPVASLRLGQL